MINCKKCGGTTAPKQIEKGPRGPWTANICTQGCMNDKGYPLHTAPPKVYQPAPHVNPGQVQPSQPGTSLGLLQEMVDNTKEIARLLKKHVEPDQLDKAYKQAQRDVPVEDTPF